MKLLDLTNKKISPNSKLIKQSNSFSNHKKEINDNINFQEIHIKENEIEEKSNYNNNILVKNGMSKEIYERLKNENVNFIQTLLRLKEKNANVNNLKCPFITPEKPNNYLNKLLNKSTNNKSNNSIYKKCSIQITPLNKIIREKDIPIKITTSLRKNNLLENKKQSNNKSEIIYPKKPTILKNNNNNNKLINVNKTIDINSSNILNKNSITKKVIKQRTLSAVPNQKQIDKINKLVNSKNKRNQDFKSYNSLNNTNSTGVTNLSINPNNEIPSAVINLFDDCTSEFDYKDNVTKKMNKYQFKQKRLCNNNF